MELPVKNIKVATEWIRGAEGRFPVKSNPVPIYNETGGCVGVVECMDRRNFDKDRKVILVHQRGSDQLVVEASNEGNTAIEMKELRESARAALFNELKK